MLIPQAAPERLRTKDPMLGCRCLPPATEWGELPFNPPTSCGPAGPTNLWGPRRSPRPPTTCGAAWQLHRRQETAAKVPPSRAALVKTIARMHLPSFDACACGLQKDLPRCRKRLPRLGEPHPTSAPLCPLGCRRSLEGRRAGRLASCSTPTASAAWKPTPAGLWSPRR